MNSRIYKRLRRISPAREGSAWPFVSRISWPIRKPQDFSLALAILFHGVCVCGDHPAGGFFQHSRVADSFQSMFFHVSDRIDIFLKNFFKHFFCHLVIDGAVLSQPDQGGKMFR